MAKVFIVYKTDTRHSYASRDTIGVATTKLNAIKICFMQAKKENQTIKDDQKWNLENIMQTQGYSGDGEFHYEEMEVNKLL